jgi:hypothetical protein
LGNAKVNGVYSLATSNVTTTSSNSSAAMQNILGTYSLGNDSVSEVNLVEASSQNHGTFTTEAIGINVDKSALSLLSQVEGQGGKADNITSAEQLTSTIGQLAGGQVIQTVAGSDVINGGIGNDVIFGDAPNTDALGISKGTGLPPGSGWLVFQELESNPSANWTRADTIAYILANQPLVATESGRQGGNDTINGGSGNDTIFGQEGNDVITGGPGSDRMSGGTGADQFVLAKGDGGTSAQTAPIDVITDFVVNTDTIVINGNGTTISSVVVSAPVANTYTITVVYQGGATEYFKVSLENGAILNDAPGGVSSSVLISGTSATIDGTIVGATLYLDINHNNQEDAGERLGITDAKGHVEWVVDLSTLDVNGDGHFTLGEARAVQSGGLDIDTGLTYEINLYGPAGSSVITPFTSLLQPLLEDGKDLASASSLLIAHLGLPAGSDLLSLNPIEGSLLVMGQNASVMTAAVQFSELLAHQLGTDEAQASFSVFSAISHVVAGLPDGQVADFSDPALLHAISDQLQLNHGMGAEVSDFMLASQLALHHSLDSLPAGGDALAAISEVQHLVQGSYAQVLASVQAGDLPPQALSDLTHTLNAYSHGEIGLDQLSSLDHQLTLAGSDHVITTAEYEHAITFLPAPLASDSPDLSHLVSSYLDTMHQVGDVDHNGTYDAGHSAAELNHQLDVSISDFIASHGISEASYASIHQQVIDHLGQDLNDLHTSPDHPVAFDSQGHADSAAVLATLDQHFQELQDHHNSLNDVIHHDVVVADHPLV